RHQLSRGLGGQLDDLGQALAPGSSTQHQVRTIEVVMARITGRDRLLRLASSDVRNPVLAAHSFGSYQAITGPATLGPRAATSAPATRVAAAAARTRPPRARRSRTADRRRRSA